MFFSLKGIRAQRHAIRHLKVTKPTPPPIPPEKRIAIIEYVCAHYTMMGLSFFIKLKDGRVIQKRITPTPKAVAELFSSIED